jgi:hypothetical protein
MGGRTGEAGLWGGGGRVERMQRTEEKTTCVPRTLPRTLQRTLPRKEADPSELVSTRDVTVVSKSTFTSRAALLLVIVMRRRRMGTKEMPCEAIISL